jgi:hypothetical protein
VGAAGFLIYKKMEDYWDKEDIALEALCQLVFAANNELSFSAPLSKKLWNISKITAIPVEDSKRETAMLLSEKYKHTVLVDSAFQNKYVLGIMVFYNKAGEEIKMGWFPSWQKLLKAVQNQAANAA